MNGSKVAYRYAKSLLEVAQAQNIIQQVYGDMQSVMSAINENHDLKDYLVSPIVKVEDKKEIINKIFGGKINPLSLNFFNLIIENKRESVIHLIVKRFIYLYDELKGVEVAKVISAVELDKSSLQRLQNIVAKITGKTAEIEQAIDESLIGGYILKIGDYQYDASVKNNIGRLHSEFKENLYIPKL